MAQDMKSIREQQQQAGFLRPHQNLATNEEAVGANIGGSPQVQKLQQQAAALFDLRREHYTLITEKRKVDLENQMLRATSDGGE